MFGSRVMTIFSSPPKRFAGAAKLTAPGHQRCFQNTGTSSWRQAWSRAIPNTASQAAQTELVGSRNTSTCLYSRHVEFVVRRLEKQFTTSILYDACYQAQSTVLYICYCQIRAKCVCCYAFCGWMSIAFRECKRIAMSSRRKRELEPEGTLSMRRGCDRLSKAKYGALN